MNTQNGFSLVKIMIAAGLVCIFGVGLYYFSASSQSRNLENSTKLKIISSSAPSTGLHDGDEKIVNDTQYTLQNKTEILQVRVTLVPIRNSGAVSTSRSNDDIIALFVKSQSIWKQADISFNYSIKEIRVDEKTQSLLAQSRWDSLRQYAKDTDGLYIFYLRSLDGPNGIAIPINMGLVADITTVDDFRASAHEIGHLLGLQHTLESRSRLLYPGANGRDLTDKEIEKSRFIANEYFSIMQ